MDHNSPVVRPSLTSLTSFTFDDYKKWKGHWELINGLAYEIDLVMEQSDRDQLVAALTPGANRSSVKFYPHLKFNDLTCLRPLLYMKIGGRQIAVDWYDSDEESTVLKLKTPIYQKAGIELVLCPR